MLKHDDIAQVPCFLASGTSKTINFRSVLETVVMSSSQPQQREESPYSEKLT